VHVSDVAELVLRLVQSEEPLPRSLDVVGPEPMSTDDLVTALRTWLGLQPRPFLPIPEIILAGVAVVGTALGIGPVNRETLVMLRGGNTGNPEAFAAVLGRWPQPIRHALALTPASQADRWHARLFFVRPLLRWSLGLLWVITGLLSFGIYPVGESYRMLADVGFQDQAATLLLYGAATIDLALGLLLLMRWRPVAVGAAMLIMMSAFTLTATGLPAEYWLHPFAPLLKNLPIAAATLAMMAMEAS
jgi:hypothetical protein